MLKVGDKIRILEDRHYCARVVKGDVLEVLDVDETGFKTDAPRLRFITGTWAFDFMSEGTGWEKVEGNE